MFYCSKVPCLGWRSADFLQRFFHQKCLLDQRKHTRSSTKISKEGTSSIRRGERERERERENVCVCVCAWVRERVRKEERKKTPAWNVNWLP
jgi:hypothetical protein